MGAIVAGGALATVREISPALRSAIKHVAAGVVFAAVAGELLPDVIQAHAPALAILGFVLGVAVVFGLRYLTYAYPATRPCAPGSEPQSGP